MLETCNKLNNLNNEINSRREKLNFLRKNNIAFLNNFRRNAISSDLYEKYRNKSNKELSKLNLKIKVAGRIINIRIMGKSAFMVLQDVGGIIQLYVSIHELKKSKYKEYFKILDLGDIIGIKGNLFKTKTNELTINCKEINLLTKSIRPLPNKFHGLINKEIKYRKRYLDLITNEKSRKIFKIRSLIISEIRNFMINNDFLEVETPMIQNIPGGALAKPFITYHNKLNINMYLRISPELYLKQLVIGGFEKIFEINRSFRNEGLSAFHNPEFTMMEMYSAYIDYNDLISFIEKLFIYITKKVFNTNIINFNNIKIDFSKSFIKMTMIESICHFYPEIKLKDLNDINAIFNLVKHFNITVKKTWSIGKIQTKIFENIVQNKLIQPTFITLYPTEVSPLAKSNSKNTFYADRFELFINGQEIGNGFSELNDPEEQIIRFKNQILYRDENEDNVIYDHDYITALEHGLPPTAGFGLGIDRLIMILTNSSSIKDVILFPTLKPIN